MKRLLASPISVMVVLFLLASPAFGQISKDGEINLFFGASRHSSNSFQIGSPQFSPPVGAQFSFTHAWRGGIRFNVATNGHWGQEFFYSYEQNRAKYRRNNMLTTSNLPLQIHNFGVTGLYYMNNDEKAA